MFSECKLLEEIIIPSSIIFIDEGAFFKCPLLTITVKGYSSAPERWNVEWNKGGNPVIWDTVE